MGEGSRGSSGGYDDCSVVGAGVVVIVVAPQGVGGGVGAGDNIKLHRGGRGGMWQKRSEVSGGGCGIICADFFNLGSGVGVNDIYGVEGRMQIVN